MHCLAENENDGETRPGIAESFAPQLSGVTSELPSDLTGMQKENRPPLSQGMLLQSLALSLSSMLNHAYKSSQGCHTLLPPASRLLCTANAKCKLGWCDASCNCRIDFW